MTNSELYKFLKFVSENNNFILLNKQKIISETFGWEIFLNKLSELEKNNLVKENDDRESYTLTKLGREKLSELIVDFESAEIDRIAERNKLHNESKLSDWQVKTFWPVFICAIFGGFYSGYDFIKNITKSEDTKETLVTKSEMELELSKLRILIIDQKKDKGTKQTNSEKSK